MTVAASYESLCVILDIGRTMSRESHPTKYDSALAAVRMLLQQKLLFGNKKDQVAIVLAGTHGASTNGACCCRMRCVLFALSVRSLTLDALRHAQRALQARPNRVRTHNCASGKQANETR